MRLLFLVLGFWLLVAFGARAQDSLTTARPAAPAAALAPGPPAVPDTVAALHCLFAAERSLRTTVVGGTLVVSGVVIGIFLLSDSSGPDSYAPFWASLVGLATVPLVLGELVHFGKHYSRRQERLAIEAFEAHRLPAGLRQQLQPLYFEPAPHP